MTGSVLDLRRLRYFEAVARLGSVSSAAKALGVAQPALSLHIARLEQHYQVKLFQRVARGMALTSAGSILFGHAEVVLSAFDQTEMTLRELGRQNTAPRDVKIALVSSLADWLAPKLLVSLKTRLPGIVPHLRMLSAQRCYDCIAEASVDVALTVKPPDRDDGEVVASAPLYLISSPEQVACPGDKIRFSELARMQLITPPKDNMLRRLIDAAASTAGVELSDLIELDGIGPRKEAVIAGLGSTIMPWANVARESAAGILVAQEIVDPQIERTITFKYRAGLDGRFVRKIRHILCDVIEAASAVP